MSSINPTNKNLSFGSVWGFKLPQKQIRSFEQYNSHYPREWAAFDLRTMINRVCPELENGAYIFDKLPLYPDVVDADKISVVYAIIGKQADSLTNSRNQIATEVGNKIGIDWKKILEKTDPNSLEHRKAVWNNDEYRKRTGQAFDDMIGSKDAVIFEPPEIGDKRSIAERFDIELVHPDDIKKRDVNFSLKA